MKRMALVGLFVSLLAGTASAQTAPGQFGASGNYSVPQSSSGSSSVLSELGSQRVILKGVGADGKVVPAAAASMLSEVNAPQESNGAPAATEMAKCEHCGQEWTDCNCCNSCDWTFFGEWLFLQPRGADAVFALRGTACAGLGPAPLLGAEQIDFGAYSGFNVGLAKRLCDGCSEIAFNWMHFESDEHDRATAIPPQTLFPLLVLDPDVTCNAATSSFARASQSIDFDRAAIDYRSYSNYNCINFDWVVGFAYGQLNQDLSARYDDTRLVRVSTDSWGYGAHIGAGGEYGSGCIRGFSHLDLTLLASNAKARYRQTEKLGVVPVVADIQQDIDRIIPVLDFQLGVAVDVCQNTVLKVGYLYSAWFNVVTTPDFVRDVQRLNFDSGSGDTLTFDGLFARVEITW